MSIRRGPQDVICPALFRPRPPGRRRGRRRRSGRWSRRCDRDRRAGRCLPSTSDARPHAIVRVRSVAVTAAGRHSQSITRPVLHAAPAVSAPRQSRGPPKHRLGVERRIGAHRQLDGPTGGAHSARYDDTAVDRLRFIQGAQRLGLPQADIRELLAFRETGESPCEPAVTLLRQRLAQIDEEINRLAALREELQRFVARIPAVNCPEPVPGTWRPRKEVTA
jgi:hypothetical protein